MANIQTASDMLADASSVVRLVMVRLAAVKLADDYLSQVSSFTTSKYLCLGNKQLLHLPDEDKDNDKISLKDKVISDWTYIIPSSSPIYEVKGELHKIKSRDRFDIVNTLSQLSSILKSSEDPNSDTYTIKFNETMIWLRTNEIINQCSKFNTAESLMRHWSASEKDETQDNDLDLRKNNFEILSVFEGAKSLLETLDSIRQDVTSSAASSAVAWAASLNDKLDCLSSLSVSVSDLDNYRNNIIVQTVLMSEDRWETPCLQTAQEGQATAKVWAAGYMVAEKFSKYLNSFDSSVFKYIFTLLSLIYISQDKQVSNFNKHFGPLCNELSEALCDLFISHYQNEIEDCFNDLKGSHVVMRLKSNKNTGVVSPAMKRVVTCLLQKIELMNDFSFKLVWVQQLVNVFVTQLANTSSQISSQGKLYKPLSKRNDPASHEGAKYQSSQLSTDIQFCISEVDEVLREAPFKESILESLQKILDDANAS